MKSKKILALIISALLIITVLPMSVFAVSRDVAADSTASITVEHALENDTLAAYKVIDIAYDAGTNHLTKAWNSDFANFFNGITPYNSTAYTVDTFSTLTDDSTDLKNLLSTLPNYIAEKSIAPVDTQTVAADGKAIFANLAMGEYFIRPTSTTSVYQLMLQKIEPVVVDGKYVIDDTTFTAKKEEVTISKTADKTSVTKGEDVTYTLTVDIPTYSANATDKSFSVYDKLPDGLTIDTDSIAYTINDTAINGSDYTLDVTATDDYTFKFSVSTEQYAASWSTDGGKKLIITYTATLNDDTTTEVNTKETNTATFDYSFYPYVANSRQQKTASVDVTTFAIKVDKCVSGNESQKLSGAKFDLYRTATTAEINAGTAVDIPHTAIKGVKLEGDLTTDANGAATFEKYEANGANYDYYLVETQAPTGYNILDNAVKVNFTDAEVADTDGVYTVRVPNSSGIRLPITGGMGTVIFTAAGILLMLIAVLLFVGFRKKSKNNG